MSRVTVFVDDVVQGHLPYVCAKTGAPADGLERIEKSIGGSGFWILLIFLGPIGWIALFALSLINTRTLTVRIPMSGAAINYERMLRRVRMVAALATIAAVAGAIVVKVQPGRGGFVVLAAMACALTVAFHVRVQFALVDIDLDASGRWVTLRGVHANFVQAVESRPVTEPIANRT